MSYPKTALDLHNERVRASKCTTTNTPPPTPPAMPDPLTSNFAAVARAAEAVPGLTISFGLSENSAVDALALMNDYFATVDGTHDIYIYDVDSDEGIIYYYPVTDIKTASYDKSAPRALRISKIKHLIF